MSVKRTMTLSYISQFSGSSVTSVTTISAPVSVTVIAPASVTFSCEFP